MTINADPTLPADAPWWARYLVDSAGECWKWLSTWAIALAAAAPELYNQLPSLQAMISPAVFHHVETAFVVLIFLGRIKRQN